MLRAFRKIFVYACLFFLVLFVLQYIVDKGLAKSKTQYCAVWNDMYQSRINADVLICGASRAKLNISPKVLDSVLNTNSFNLGINGGFFPIQYAMLKAYLQHNKKPKYILQNVDFAIFTNGPHLSNSDQFIPYLSDTLVRNMASLYEEKFSIPEIYFPLFKYNNHMNLIKEGVFCYFNIGHRGTNGLYKGFGAPNTPFDDFFQRRLKTDAAFIKNNIDKKTDSSFSEYLEYCKSNDIKVIFIYGPILQPVTKVTGPDSSAVTRKILEYAQKYNIPYLSYLDDSVCYRQEMFVDHIHLNAKGSQAYNLLLANGLKKIIQK